MWMVGMIILIHVHIHDGHVNLPTYTDPDLREHEDAT